MTCKKNLWIFNTCLSNFFLRIQLVLKMAVDRREANLKMLNEASEVQNKTKDAIWRIQRQAEEAEGLGNQTLEELRRQGQQMVSYI